MSSGIRTLQKRIFKRIGYVRQTQKIDEKTGAIIHLRKGEGQIIGPDHQPVGQNYPRFLPPMDGNGTPKRKGAARGSRRGTTRKGYRHQGDGLPR